MTRYRLPSCPPSRASRLPREGRRGSAGFTLIELMIVVAIIAIVAAIAIPSLLHARTSSNEASAINSLRTLTTANTQYRVRFGQYAPTVVDLATAGYIDDVLGSAPTDKSGYLFTYTLVAPASAWEVVAVPIDNGGDRGFFVDTSGVITFTLDGSAPDASSPPID